MAAATSLTRTLPAGALTYRGCLRARLFQGQGHIQKRWVGQKYLAKVAEADRQWSIQAQKMKMGKMKNLFDELDERGFVKDVVGR